MYRQTKSLSYNFLPKQPLLWNQIQQRRKPSLTIGKHQWLFLSYVQFRCQQRVWETLTGLESYSLQNKIYFRREPHLSVVFMSAELALMANAAISCGCKGCLKRLNGSAK